MASLFFNDPTITADRNVLDHIRLYVTADTLWAVEPELDPANETGD